MNRRAFIRSASITTVAVASGCAPSIPLYRASHAGMALRIAKDIPELGRVGGTIRVEPGDGRKPILVTRTASDSYVALSLECSHLGCVVRVDGDLLRCPCHGSVYDRTGEVLNGPAQIQLDSYTVRAEGELLLLTPSEGVHQ